MPVKNEIPVFFTIDDSYAPYLAVALNSAIKNSSPQNRYRAIILHQGVSVENQCRIKSLAQKHFSIEFIPMEKGLESITDSAGTRRRCDYFTLTIYFRLFIPAMFPEYDKAIYIDSDVVIPGDLAELYSIDLGDNYLGACPDFSIECSTPLVKYTELAVGTERGKYFNSGVLLMNLKALREKELDKHFLTLLNTYNFDCIAPDQDYLNAMCKGKVLLLDECWDAMPCDWKQPLNAPKLIHYNLFSKPWCYDNIQYGDYFWKYVVDSYFNLEILAHKRCYSQQQKDSDNRCMELLVKRGLEIAEQSNTFRQMESNGVKIRL